MEKENTLFKRFRAERAKKKMDKLYIRVSKLRKKKRNVMHKKQLKNPYYTRGERKERKWRHAEKNFMLFMFKIRRKKLTSFMKMMTWIGDGWIWTVICILFLPIQVHTGIALCAASLIEVGLQQILKHIFTRQRPYIKHDDITNLMLPPDKFSFPSGHTAAAFTMFFVMLSFFPILAIPFGVLAGLIAISRMYLGLHYPSDVLAGIVLGYISAWSGIHLVLFLEI